MTGSQIDLGLWISILMFAAVAFFLTYLIASYFMKDQFAVSKRLKKISAASSKKGASRVVSKDKKNNGIVTNKLRELGFMDSLGEKLLEADIMVRPEEYLTIWAMAAVFPALIALLITFNAILALVLMIAGALIPWVYIIFQKGKKVQKFDAQLADALMIMSNCLASGLSFQQAMDNISKEMPDPIAGEFGRTVKEIKFGKNTEQALEDMAQRIGSSDLMLAMTAIIIQHQVGGNLSEILLTIAETIKDRFKIKQEISVMTTQGKLSGIIVGALPVVIGLLLTVMSPQYMMPFFQSPLGLIMLVIAVIMDLIGFVCVKKIVTIEY